MKKIFISQPMFDKTHEEILCVRELAVLKCKNIFNDIEVLDSYFTNIDFNVDPLWYLGDLIKILSKSDVVYFCKDWQKYRGCIIEHECAVRYGKEVLYE